MTDESGAAPSSSAPRLDIDLYADDVLADSRDAFARIRHAGPVVWLPRHRMYAVGRVDDVRAALRDPETFISGCGVTANGLFTRLGRGTTLFSDGQLHASQRRILRQQLGPTALEEIQDRVEEHPERIVARCCRGDSFDVVRDFSSQLPIGVVAELVGVRGGSERMLRWAAATFDLLGPLNRRAVAAMPTSLGLLLYTLRFSAAGVWPRRWAAAVFDARGPCHLRAMVPHVRRMTTSNPTRLRNNTLQGFSGLTARFN